MIVNGYRIGVKANLQGANLRWANLREANLREANLQGANLRWANLREANLRWANLRWANLQGANLRWANLQGADLQGADLRWANLQGANLREANLQGADLRWANLRGANLQGANLQGANLPHFLIVPETGGFFAYKKLAGNVIVKIYIPASAKRTNSLTGRKCRASKVKVISVVQGVVTHPIPSTHYKGNLYFPGQTVKADKWDGDIRVECTHGIHFFMTLKEAEEWK